MDFGQQAGEQAPIKSGDRVRLAVYDFDGTCIDGNSPAQLVRYLMFKRKLKFSTSVTIGLWALRYKLQLPQNESWVRSKVFSAFEGQPAEEVDAYLRDFYDEVIAPRYRPKAEKDMRMRLQEGCVTMVVSASWQAIVDRARESHSINYAFATRMCVDAQGRYTTQVRGLPVEGDEKLNVIKQFADERFGEGCWELAYAYGDHHSDAPMLAAAGQAFAVTPDNPLERMAKRRGWTVLDWSTGQKD